MPSCAGFISARPSGRIGVSPIAWRGNCCHVYSSSAPGEALDLVRERLRGDARFRPAASTDLLTLVTLARTAGDRSTVRLLLQDFSKFYPEDPAQAVVDQLTAQLL